LFAGDFDMAFVSKFAKSAGSHNGLAHSEDFISRNVLITGQLHLPGQINSAVSLIEDIDSDQDRCPVIIFLLEHRFTFTSQLLASLPCRWNTAKIGNFQLA